MKYESTILKRLIDTYGVVGNPRYISEIIKEFIVRGKECFPELFTYQADWLAHIDEFGLTPEYTVSYTGQHIYAPNTKEKPVKSAILSGNTLVNLVKKTTINVESNQNDLWININKLYGGNLPKGKYILLYNIKKASSSTFRCTPRINLSDGTALFEGFENYNTTPGIKKWIFNATAEITDVYFWINTNTEPILIEDFILLEYQQGMENWDIPYFEGMTSVRMPVLSTTGKNLLDVESVFKVDGNTVKEAKDGSVVLYKPSHNSFILETIKVKANTTYTISCKIEKIIDGGRAVYGLGGVTENKTAMSDSSGNLTLFMRAGDQNSEGEYKFYNIQLEEGSTATTYEPYKSNILTCNEEVELRGIDDIKDTLDLTTGELIQRIDKVVLDGGEDKDLKKGTWDKENTVAFYLTFDETATQSGRLKFLCNELKFNNNFYHVDEECILYTANVNGTVELYIRLLRSRLENASVEGLKSYLSKNPIVVLRQRIKPVIKTVDLNIKDQNNQVVNHLTSFEGGTHFDTSSQTGSVLPTLEVDVVVDLEETLMVCSTEGNTM